MTAADRGWGQPPVSRDLMVDVRAGTDQVRFPGGVHRQIVPLVVELVARLEQETGEKAVEGWCWGYAPRRVRGSTSTWSNHAWGLAVDFNAPDHPLGATGTWGRHADTVRRTAEGLGFTWGGVWARPDPMHFEFSGTPDDARDRIAALEDDMTPQQADMLARIHAELTREDQHGTIARYVSSTNHAVGRMEKVHGKGLAGLSGDVDVDRLAAVLSEQLGDEVAAALGRKLTS